MTGSSEFKAVVRKRMEITGESYTRAMRQVLAVARGAVPLADPPPRQRVQRWVPRAWDPPQTELPGIVPIDTLAFDRSEQTAIAITGISAYSNGFEIFAIRLIRPDAPGLDEDPVPGWRGPEPFRFSLQFSDGRTLTDHAPHGRGAIQPPGDAEPAEPVLWSRGGGGTTHYQHLSWWVWPLPPSGPLEFSCQLGTGETRVGIDAQLILDAAQRSVRVWPDES
jgi:hypothetical protein